MKVSLSFIPPSSTAIIFPRSTSDSWDTWHYPRYSLYSTVWILKKTARAKGTLGLEPVFLGSGIF